MEKSEIAQKYRAVKRECYLRSTPSVDLDLVTEDNPINCINHRLEYDELERIYSEYGVNEDLRLLEACNMWLLFSGPSIVNG